MTALEKFLIQLIKAQGPISIATFMAEALGNEKYGYYMKQDPFGQQGDFTTAPEISQMFGEMIGLWLAGGWLNMGRPEKTHLIELGPGRGTLMQDIIRFMKIVPGLADLIKTDVIQPHLVEMSPRLKEIQAGSLRDHDITALWHNRLHDALSHAGGEPVLIIANEFFDALPVRQFQKTDTGWHERLINLDSSDALSLQLAPVPSPEQIIPDVLLRADNSSIAEICPAGEHILAEITEYISQHGGAALIIDYGHDDHGTGDTLQAVKAHKYHNILSDPGDVDLTAHVNFRRLKEVALDNGCHVHGPTGQGPFLKRMGIETRSRKLLARATDRQKKDILSALHRLTHGSEMGELFRVMAITAPDISGVIGFGE